MKGKTVILGGDCCILWLFSTLGCLFMKLRSVIPLLVWLMAGPLVGSMTVSAQTPLVQVGTAWQSLVGGGQLLLEGAEDVSVRQAGQGIAITYTASNCLPIASSFNRSTVVLTDVADPNRLHPLHTASWTGLSPSRLVLSVAIPGYELPALTEHRLLLKGGSGGVQFDCGTAGIGYLPGDVDWSFKTGADTFAPAINDFKAAASLNNAQVWWKGGEVTTGRVEYGLTTGYGSSVTTAAGMDHKAQLSGSQPGKTYYYRITSTDSSGNASVETGSFATWAMGSISVTDVTGHEASIRWTTSTATDSMVEYGTSAQYNLRSGSKNLTTTHEVRLINLKSKTDYHFRIKASNSAGVAVTSDLTFATRDALAGPAPDVVEFPEGVFDLADEWSRYNLKDFPDDPVLAEATSSADEASQGAVLADTDNQSGVVSYVKKGVKVAEERLGWWVVWIVFPLLLVLLIIVFYLYYKHDLRMNGWRLEMREIEAKRGFTSKE